MLISREDVDKVAYLARLELADEEKEQLRQQLAKILEHIAVLQELETDHIAPTSRVVTLQNVTRADVVTPSMPVADVLANAPDQQEDLFRLRAVLEDQ
jgi:aspartyl-tRNA(Asn)/glutamyl-tRNA(Gln) amidotransferase subunit C